MRIIFSTLSIRFLVVWKTLVFSPLLISGCFSITRSRSVERCTRGDRCFMTGRVGVDW